LKSRLIIKIQNVSHAPAAENSRTAVSDYIIKAVKSQYAAALLSYARRETAGVFRQDMILFAGYMIHFSKSVDKRARV
jgi:hypothetical protein